MTDADSDLLVRVASRDPAALGELYDRHARSVYGYALAITRRPAEARRTLLRTFEALAREADAASAAASLRRHLLALARPIAWAERSRWRLRFPALPRAYALDPEASSPDLIAETNAKEDEEDKLLLAVEGFGDARLEEPEAEPTAPGTTTRGAWRPPPPSMRALVLFRAREAARPARRYVRWLLSWALFAAALLLAFWTDVASPRLPDVSYTPPPGRMGEPLREELRVRRHLHWILEGFRREGERK